MIFLFLILSIISFYFRENIVFKSIFTFCSLIIVIFLLYYFFLFLYIMKNKKKIENLFQVPEEVINNNLKFYFKLSSFFFLSQCCLFLLTDKCEIPFFYDQKLNCFKAVPFYRGKHKITKFYLKFSDPLKFLTINIKFPIIEFYHFFSYDGNFNQTGILPLSSNDVRKFKAMDDSVLIRDYLFGDDVRKILWRVYAITDDIKVRTDWLEKTSFNFLPINICGIYSENYFFSNLIIYKIYNLMKGLLLKNFNLSINGKIFKENDDIAIQKELFSVYESEKRNGISYQFNQNSILIFSASAVNKNPRKELWIPKNKAIYYITLKDFFSVDKKNYYSTNNFISLFIKKPKLDIITKFYFSNYLDYDILYEKRYPIV